MTQSDQRGGGERRRARPLATFEALRLARNYRRVGRWRDAYIHYCRVLKRRADDPAVLLESGEVALEVGRGEEAVLLLRRSIAKVPDIARAHHLLSRALGASGQLDAALAASAEAIRLAPASVDVQAQIGDLLARQGRADEALAAFDRTLVMAPDHADATYLRGLALHELGRLDEAATWLRRATELDPGRGEAHYSLGTTLHGMRRFDEAIAAYDRAIALRSDLVEGVFEVGKPRHIHARFDKGDHRAALPIIEEFLRRRPGHAGALALKAIALEEIGEVAPARALVDFDRLIRAQPLAPELSNAELSNLNAALARHVRQHPTLGDAPSAFSVYRGKSTGELLTEPKGPIRRFERLIRAAVDRYRRDLPDDADHPFIAAKPERWHLTMWAIIIEAEGFQVPHIHPSGWLSAVYYVKVPEIVRSSGDNAGWIEFGEPYRDIERSYTPEVRRFRPEEGLLLLFPSYFWHRTLPFRSNEQRISISFDVIAAR